MPSYDIGAWEIDSTPQTASDAPAQSISDASSLYIYTTSWTTELGGRINLYQSINETTADDSTFIQSEALAVGNATVGFDIGAWEYPFAAPSLVSFSLSDPPVSIGTGTGRVRVRYYKQSAEVLSLTVRLMQGVTVIKSWTYTNIGFDVVEADETLTAPEVATITDGTALTLKCEASWTP